MKLMVAIMIALARIARIPFRTARMAVPSPVRALALDMAAAAIGIGIVALPMLMLGLPG